MSAPMPPLASLGQSHPPLAGYCEYEGTGEPKNTILRNNDQRTSIHEFPSQPPGPAHKFPGFSLIPGQGKIYGNRAKAQPFPSVNEPREVMERNKRRIEAERTACEIVSRQQREERRKEEEHLIQFEEASRQEAAATLPLVIQGSFVVFAAGLQVRRVITAFEACQITVEGVPNETQEAEIITLLTQQGLDAARFHITCNSQVAGASTKQDVNIVTDMKSADIIAMRRSGIPFTIKGEQLSFSVRAFGKLGGMKELPTDSQVSVSLKPLSSRYAVGLSEDLVEKSAQQLSRHKYYERRLRVTRIPPDTAGNEICTFEPNLRISNLSHDITDADVAELLGKASSIRRLPDPGLSADLDSDPTLNGLRGHILRYFPDQLIAFDIVSNAFEGGNLPSVLIRLSNHNVASAVRKSLQGKRFGNFAVIPRISTRRSLTYTIAISQEQYRAQQSQWDELYDSITNRTRCNLEINQQGSSVNINVIGLKREAVGALKVRVESLVAGEKVEGWHPLLPYFSSHLVQSIEDVGAYVTADLRHQKLALYGRPKEVRIARQIIEDELERLSNIDWPINIPRRSVGFLLKHGLPALQEMFGEDCVKLDAFNCEVTIRGSADVHHHFTCLIEESEQDRSTTTIRSAGSAECPICLSDISAPHKLGCGHEYCTACLRHLLTTAIGTKVFPLVCLACTTPISIPLIKRFLPITSFLTLAEEAFNFYVHQHHQEIKNCPTPGCTKQYRSSQTSTKIECPSCLNQICSACGAHWRSGHICALEQEMLSEKWIASQPGIRKCPKCQRLLEKRGGCNHMTCPCGAHICWQCMRAFLKAEIYTHMRSVHGGIHGVDEPPALAPTPVPDVQQDPFLGADYFQQALLLEHFRLQQQATGRVQPHLGVRTRQLAPVHTIHRAPVHPLLRHVGRGTWFRPDDEVNEY